MFTFPSVSGYPEFTIPSRSDIGQYQIDIRRSLADPLRGEAIAAGMMASGLAPECSAELRKILPFWWSGDADALAPLEALIARGLRPVDGLDLMVDTEETEIIEPGFLDSRWWWKDAADRLACRGNFWRTLFLFQDLDISGLPKPVDFRMHKTAVLNRLQLRSPLHWWLDEKKVEITLPSGSFVFYPRLSPLSFLPCAGQWLEKNPPWWNLLGGIWLGEPRTRRLLGALLESQF